MKDHHGPSRQGLYDPAHEHESCGVGFVVDLKGRKSSKIVHDAIQVLLNLQHRGACGCEKNTGDGAGILMQIPHKFLAEVCDALPARIKLPDAGHYGVGVVFLPGDPNSRAACENVFEQAVRDEGQTFLGWRDGARRQPDDRADGHAVAAGHQAALHRAQPRHRRRRGVRAQAVRHPAPGPPRRPQAGHPRKGSLLHPQPLVADDRLQGDAEPRPDDAVLPRPAGRSDRVGAGPGALALLDQHLPQLVARASLPDDRAQRRDQHAARQRQLDARAREHVRVEAVRRRPEEVHPGRRHRRQRLGDVRQRAGAAGPVGPLAAARDDDDDPGAVVEPRVHVAPAQGLLRVPRLPDGAVGRPGVGGVHRRHPHRRHAGPQRPAPVALLRHQGRPGRHGVRGRRAGHRARPHPREGASAAGAHVPGRHVAGAHHRRRRDQGRARQGRAVRAVAQREPHLDWPTCPSRPR